MNLVGWNNIPVGVKDMIHSLVNHFTTLELNIHRRKRVTNDRICLLQKKVESLHYT